MIHNFYLTGAVEDYYNTFQDSDIDDKNVYNHLSNSMPNDNHRNYYYKFSDFIYVKSEYTFY